MVYKLADFLSYLYGTKNSPFVVRPVYKEKHLRENSDFQCVCQVWSLQNTAGRWLVSFSFPFFVIMLDIILKMKEKEQKKN